MVKHIKSGGKWVLWFLLTYLYCVPGVSSGWKGWCCEIEVVSEYHKVHGGLVGTQWCSGFIEETCGFVEY